MSANWTKADMRVRADNLGFLNTLVGDAKGQERIGRALGHSKTYFGTV
jgi:hypothetical protein